MTINEVIKNIWEKREWYAIHDSDGGPCIPVSVSEALDKNERGYGIFWTVNQMEPGKRKTENLVKILSWAVDLDEGTKEEQMERIKQFVEPSVVMETKKGFHVYYDAINPTIENHKEIMARLVYNLHGDKRAKDLARILRCPYFGHMKDPSNPYFVTHRDPTCTMYTEEEMLKCFPSEKKVVAEQKREFKKILVNENHSDLFERIWSLNCKDALERISGTSAICLDKIEFVRTGRGHNLIVNGKTTSCWVDAKGRIGSCDGGGPTIWQWINWYHNDHKKTYKFIKENFTELFDG